MSKLDQVRALREAKFGKAPKPKATVRKPIARRVTKKAATPKRVSAAAIRREFASIAKGFDAMDTMLAIPIEPCPNCGGTGKRPRSMTAAERQRLRRARMKGGK